MKLWQVIFHGNRPPIIVFGKTASQVKRDMRDMFGHDMIDEVDPISREDAENEYGRDYEKTAKIFSVVKEDLIPQWLRRAIMKPKMKKLVLAYLRWRRDNPGQGRKGVQQVVKLMGLSPQDGNQLVDTLNDMVKKGEMPKHLAIEDQEQIKKETVMSETGSFLAGDNPFYYAKLTEEEKNTIKLKLDTGDDDEKDDKKKDDKEESYGSVTTQHGDGYLKADKGEEADPKTKKIQELEKDLRIAQLNKEIEGHDDPEPAEKEKQQVSRPRVKDRGDRYECVGEDGKCLKQFPYDNKKVSGKSARYEAQRWAEKYVQEKMNEEFIPEKSPPWDDSRGDYASAAKHLTDYAKKHGGIDKRDFLAIANQFSAMSKKKAPNVGAKMAQNIAELDTDVREVVIQILRLNGFKVTTRGTSLTIEELQESPMVIATIPNNQSDHVKKLEKLCKDFGCEISRKGRTVTIKGNRMDVRRVLSKMAYSSPESMMKVVKEEVELEEMKTDAKQWTRGAMAVKKIAQMQIAKSCSATLKDMAHQMDAMSKSPNILQASGYMAKINQDYGICTRSTDVKDELDKALKSVGLMEDADLEERAELRTKETYTVIYYDKNGRVKGEKDFDDRKKADKYAELGNSRDKVGGRYKVTVVNEDELEEAKVVSFRKLDKKVIDTLKSMDKDDAKLIIQGLPKSMQKQAMKAVGIKEDEMSPPKVDGRTRAYKETAARLMAKKQMREADLEEAQSRAQISRDVDKYDPKKAAAMKKKAIEMGYGKKNKMKEDSGVSKEKEDEFHNKLDDLMHKTFGPSPDEKMKESTKEYAKSLEQLANKAKREKITPKDLETLSKLADLMKKANEELEEKKDDDQIPSDHQYMKGIDKDERDDKQRQIDKQTKMSDDDPDAYKPMPGDTDKDGNFKKTKMSKHTKKYHQMYGEEQLVDEDFVINEEEDNSLEGKAKKSGIPLGILKQVYNRGMAAWKTGHRPGASQQQWAHARVNSFITKGSGTWGKADKDLAAKVKKEDCWDGYTQKGMKMKGGRQVPNCVQEDTSFYADFISKTILK